MKISPINFQKISNHNITFKKQKAINQTPSFGMQEYSLKDKAKIKTILAKSDFVLSRTDTIKKIAQKKLEEAQKIQKEWLKNKSQTIAEKDSIKEYIGTWNGTLKTYIEKRADKTERTIEYLESGIINITELDANGKKHVYVFEKGALRKHIQGIHKEHTKGEIITTTPHEFIFSNSGNLTIYRENYKFINVYNKSQELLGNFSTIDTVLYFNTAEQKTYLQKAKTGVYISPIGKQLEEEQFEFDENGKLIK